MKPSTFLLCLAPTITFALEAGRVPHAVAPSPSQPNNTPPAPLAGVQTSSQDESQSLPEEAQQMLNLQAETKPETMAVPLLSKTAFSLRARALKSSTELTKRSEGTLGQTPWIGMAIGLTCTTLAAVMLG